MQLTFFLDDSDEERKESNKKISEIEKKRMALSISERITDEFDIVQIPFIGYDFDLLYHQIVKFCLLKQYLLMNSDLIRILLVK